MEFHPQVVRDLDLLHQDLGEGFEDHLKKPVVGGCLRHCCLHPPGQRGHLTVSSSTSQFEHSFHLSQRGNRVAKRRKSEALTRSGERTILEEFRELADRFKLSRIVIREAMKSLEERGVGRQTAGD